MNCNPSRPGLKRRLLLTTRSAGLAAALLWPTLLIAQDSPPPMNPELRASANGIRDAAHSRLLTARRLDIAVEVRGAVAETVTDVVFTNPTSETLEGNFRLSLPAGAVVTGYALDINGAMIDGVLVDRPRAKAVYDARVRRGIDPGLAEVTPDNLFETRIYPILPQGERHIRLRFTAPIGPDGLHLPLAAAAPTQGWTIDIHATGADAAPKVLAPGGKQASFDRTADGYTASFSGGPVALTGELSITPAASPETLVSTHRSGERDVQLSGHFAQPARATNDGALRIYWNRSRSRLASDHDAEIALVRQLIDNSKPSSVEIIAFNSSGANRTTVSSAEAAAAWLKALTYRGATSYAPVAHDPGAGHCILFSDEAPTIDRTAEFAPHCRLDVVSSSATADKAWLHHLATSHGGDAYALDPKNGVRIATQLSQARAGVVAVLDQDGRPLPYTPLETVPGQWLILARAPAGGPITVRIADGSGVHDIVRTLDAAPVAFDGAGALIASDLLATLGGTEQRDAFVALSRRYGIASPSLSFLVLETPTDYLQAKVAPPSNYPSEARDSYLRMLKAQEANRAGDRQKQLDRTVAEWADLVKWWETRFDPKARPARVVTSRNFDRTRDASMAVEVASPAPPPPPDDCRNCSTSPVMAEPSPAPPPPPSPAPPPPANAARTASEVADVVVTSRRRATGDVQGRVSSASDAPVDASPTIRIDAWQPDRPYLELYDGKPSDFDERFLEAERRHGSLPIFYFDTAEWLRRHGRNADAVEMLLSALELPTANDTTLGIVADRLERYGEIDRAIELRERQAVLDPDRPQPRRLLALALARRAALQPQNARQDLTRAVTLLYDIAITPLDGPWNGIEMIALDEANALLPRLRNAGGAVSMDPRLVRLLDVDMRVVIDWTTDGSDMDLWVDEPDQERAIYNNPRTAIGGHLSRDIRQGYGPEEYLLHHAPPGTYVVQADVVAPDRLDPNGVTFLTAHLIKDFGRPTEQDESVDLELKRDEQGSKMIGRMVFPPSKPGE